MKWEMLKCTLAPSPIEIYNHNYDYQRHQLLTLNFNLNLNLRISEKIFKAFTSDTVQLNKLPWCITWLIFIVVNNHNRHRGSCFTTLAIHIKKFDAPSLLLYHISTWSLILVCTRVYTCFYSPKVNEILDPWIDP